MVRNLLQDCRQYGHPQAQPIHGKHRGLGAHLYMRNQDDLCCPKLIHLSDVCLLLHVLSMTDSKQGKAAN
jgi:hypothetical protein